MAGRTEATDGLLRKQVEVAVAEFGTGELTVIVDRAPKGVQALGRRDFKVYVEIQTTRPNAKVVVVTIVIKRNRGTEVSVYQELRLDQVGFGETREWRRDWTTGVHPPKQLDDRALRRIPPFAFVNA